jgi:hypothetical protein
MRFPQVGERMREAPAQALRAMFAGIGQVLLVADRMRSHPAGPDADQPGADKHQLAAPRPVAADDAAARRPAAGPLRPAGSQPADLAGGHPAGQEASRWRSLDETGNVRILPVSDQTRSPAEPAPAQSIPPAEPGLAEQSATDPGLAEQSATEPAVAEPVSADTTGPVELPIANYDDLSLASLRARLRNLDSAQLHALLGYERAHAARPAVLGMFERRISKLETGQG